MLRWEFPDNYAVGAITDDDGSATGLDALATYAHSRPHAASGPSLTASECTTTPDRQTGSRGLAADLGVLQLMFEGQTERPFAGRR